MLFLLGLVGVNFAGATDMNSVSPYVYKVTCTGFSGIGGMTTTLTGFQVDGVRGVITSLHGVLKCQHITLQNGKRDIYDLTVTAVDIDKDLALVVSPTLSNQAGGFRTGETPSDGSELEVWGYPWDSFALQPSRQLYVRKRRERLEILLGTGPDVEQWRMRGSPAINSSVISIEGHLEMGHSGSPVLRPDGTLIGVASGGRGQGHGAFVWAVPLSADEVRQWRHLQTADERRLMERPVKAGLLGKTIADRLPILGSDFSADYLTVITADLTGFPDEKVWAAYNDLVRAYTGKVDAVRAEELRLIQEKIYLRRFAPQGQIIRDFATGLRWAKPPQDPPNYKQAGAFCAALQLEHGRWRLPTLDELQQIRRGDGQLHPLMAGQGNRVWSMTPFGRDGEIRGKKVVYVLNGSALNFESVEGEPSKGWSRPRTLCVCEPNP